MLKVISLAAIIILIVLLNITYPNQFWVRQSTPINTWLYKCSFPDSLHGWAAGDEGKIIYTSNGGINWIEQNSPVDFFIYSIYFINERLGWGVANDHYGTGTAVLSTTNGGMNWSMFRYPDTTTFFYTIYFHDSLNGWMGGYGGDIVRTTDAGVNWQTTQNDSSFASLFPIYDVKFYNSDIGFACGGYYDLAGVIWKTTNKGAYWEAQAISYEPLNDICFIDSSNIIAVGGDFEFGASLAKTTNSGTNWNYNSLFIFGEASAVSFRTQQEGWMALSFAERLAYTTNTGVNWMIITPPDSSGIYDLTFTDENHGWAVGKNGTVLKYDTSTIGIKKINQNILVTSYKLYQNYPNPFNPTTIIKYGIPKNGHVKLIVYDVLGKDVAILINDEQDAGNYEITFDASKLPSGVYFYKITSGDLSEVKKMLFVK